VPDFLLVRADQQVQVVNVKPAARLADPVVAEALGWPDELFEGRGWGHEIWTGADPVLLANVRFLAEERIAAARGTPATGLFTVAAQEFRRGRQGPSGRVYVTEAAMGKRRNLTHEDEAAFWSWLPWKSCAPPASGSRRCSSSPITASSPIRCRPPARSCRCCRSPRPRPIPNASYLVSPELAEVLTAIIFRVRAGNAALPLVSAYDVFEQTWSAPMPFLFQRRYGSEDRPITRSYIRECMVTTSRAAQITAAGSRWNGGPMTSGESSSPTPSGPGCLPVSPRKSAGTPCWTPQWATLRSTPKTWYPTTGPSSPAVAPSGPAKNTAISRRLSLARTDFHLYFRRSGQSRTRL
jgi:hypothetical protein